MTPWPFTLQTSVLLLTLCACASVPLDQRYTLRQLLAQYRRAVPCQATHTTAGFFTDFNQCAQDERQRKANLAKAIYSRVDRDMGSAPGCFRSQHIDPTELELLGIRTTAQDAPAALMASGVTYVSTEVTADCLTEICDWQGKVEPDHDKLVCSQNSARDGPA
jgi:hypothetical protein